MSGPRPIHVAVTGAAGQIGDALVSRIASGQLFELHQPVVLRLWEMEAGQADPRGGGHGARGLRLSLGVRSGHDLRSRRRHRGDLLGPGGVTIRRTPGTPRAPGTKAPAEEDQEERA